MPHKRLLKARKLFAQQIQSTAIELKQAENALRESKAQLALSLRAGKAGTFEWNIKNDVNIWSPEIEKMYGVPEGTFEGNLESWRKRVEPDDAATVEQGIQTALANRESDYEYEFRAILPDETRCWFAGRARFEYDASGEPLRMIGINVDINERKQTEVEREELIRRERAARLASETVNNQLSKILESIADGFVTLDREWRFTYLNPLGTRIIGRSSQELSGKNVWNEFPELAETGFGKLFRRAASENTALALEDYYPPFNAWFNVRVYPNEHGLSIFFLDISERKTVEQQLSQNREIMSLAMRSSRMGAWWQDVPTDKVWWSRELEAIFGLESGGFSGCRSGFYDFVYSVDKQPIEILIKQAIAERRDYVVEFRFHHADGSLRWMEGRGRAIYSDKGEPTKIYGIGIDITERKESEISLKNNEEQLRLAVQATKLGLWDFDPISNHFECTGRFCEIFGMPRGTTFTPKDLHQTIHLEDREKVALAIAQALNPAGDGKFELDYRIVQPASGLVRWIHAIGQAQFERLNGGATTQATRFIGTFQDISERKQAEKEREQLLHREQTARLEAEEANRLKDEFLATVSHELRTPLNAIIGWATIARQSNFDDEMVKRAIEVIERNGRGQNQIISDILDVSRIITGKLNLEIKPVEPTQIIETAIETLRPAIEAKNIELETVFYPRTKLILGDANRLQQIFWNLLANSVKFTPANGKIKITVEATARNVEISFSDDGEGIESEFLPFVFDRFRQAEGAENRRHGGLGLGLSIVRHLVELHGGAVSAASAGKNNGSKFVVRLPLLFQNPEPGDEQTLQPGAAVLVSLEN